MVAGPACFTYALEAVRAVVGGEDRMVAALTAAEEDLAAAAVI